MDRENEENDFEIETNRVIQESSDNLVENELLPDDINEMETPPPKI